MRYIGGTLKCDADCCRRIILKCVEILPFSKSLRYNNGE